MSDEIEDFTIRQEFLVMICPNDHWNVEMRKVDVEGGWEWRCCVCDHRFGFFSDGGQLDIGIISEPSSDGPQIFSEGFE